MVRKIPSKLKKTNKLWIFCEGKTEKLYFQGISTIQRARIKIVLKEAGVTRADQILKQANKFKNKKFKINGDSYDPNLTVS